MTLRITVFTALGPPGTGLVIASGAIAGDKVLQVMALAAKTTQDVTSDFGPFIPSNGMIEQLSSTVGPLSSSDQCIALLQGS